MAFLICFSCHAITPKCATLMAKKEETFGYKGYYMTLGLTEIRRGAEDSQKTNRASDYL